MYSWYSRIAHQTDPFLVSRGLNSSIPQLQQLQPPTLKTHLVRRVRRVRRWIRWTWGRYTT